MALVTCPTCGYSAVRPQEACPSCRTTVSTERGTMTARILPADDLSTDFSPMHTAEAQRLNRQREARVTRLSPFQELAEELGPATSPNGDDNSARSAKGTAVARERSGPRPPTPRARLGLLAALVGLALLALSSVTLLPGLPGRGLVGAHAQPTVVPTITATPSPATMPGFKLFADTSVGFQIQYPATWAPTQNDLDVSFYDSLSTYQLQVDYPDDPSQCAQGDVASRSACWVDYVLGQEQQIRGNQFQRLNGPIPAAIIGGQTWQSGVAEIGDQQAGTRIRYQVFATLWSGKPYIIALLATDEVFMLGDQRYFEPMLQSFQFLPNAS